MSYVLYDPEAPVIRPKRRTTKIVLTPEQQDWLREHFATTLNKEIAAHLGVSLRTTVRLARELGLEKDPAWFHGVVMERCAMMAEANRGEGNAGKANLLKYGKAHYFKPGVSSRERLGDERERERIEKSAAARRETVRKELQRIRWGFDQQTRLKLTRNDSRTAMRYTLKRRGYIIPHRGANVAFFNSSTDRSSVVEAHARERGITIILLHEGNVQPQGCIKDPEIIKQLLTNDKD